MLLQASQHSHQHRVMNIYCLFGIACCVLCCCWQGPRVVSLLQAAAAGPLVQRLLDMCQGNSKDRWTTENHRW